MGLAGETKAGVANYYHVQDVQQIFLAKAAVLDAAPEDLELYTDVSWLARGDYYYLQRLLETLYAYRGHRWVRPR